MTRWPEGPSTSGVPADDAQGPELLEDRAHPRAGAPGRLDEIAGAERCAEPSEHGEDLLRSLKEEILLLRGQPARRCEGQPDAAAGLVVLRIREAVEPHLLEDPSDPFPRAPE